MSKKVSVCILRCLSFVPLVVKQDEFYSRMKKNIENEYTVNTRKKVFNHSIGQQSSVKAVWNNVPMNYDLL